MQTLTVYRIERETDPSYSHYLDQYRRRNLWKIFYKKNDKVGGVSWVEGGDEMAAFANFKNNKLNDKETVKDRFIVELGGE